MHPTEVGEGATALLAGNSPTPIQFGIIPWVLRSTLLIPILQIIGVVASIGLLNRWKRNPENRPSQERIWGRYILPSVILNLIPIASGLAVLASNVRGFLTLFLPDLSWLAMLSGGFALLWTFLRTGLIIHTTRHPGSD